MSHIIVTRLGIGVLDPAFYETHLRYLALTLARSLASQTCQDYSWVVVADIRAPRTVEREIARFAPAAHVWRVDPVERASLNPIVSSEIRKMVTGDHVTITRADDDDFLCREYVERVAERLNGKSLAAYTAPAGVTLTGDGVARPMVYPWNAQGLTVRSPVERMVSPYSGAHQRFAELIERCGGEAVVDSACTPRWLRTLRGGSASGGASLRPAAPVDIDPATFGATEGSLKALCELVAMEPPPSKRRRIPGTGRPATKLRMKAVLLRQIAEMRQHSGDAKTAARIAVMTQLFYTL